jgi:ribosomal-protein-alanine N-acetyltransferase
MDSFSPRLADSEDLEQILTLEKACYPEPWSADHFVTEIERSYSRVYVLTDDETDSIVVGYIIYWMQTEGASLLNVCVDPKWRGLGLAQKLMQVMIKDVVREEIPRIILEVRKSNENAIELYKKIGFKTMHEREKFYRNGESALVMEIQTSTIQTMIQ